KAPGATGPSGPVEPRRDRKRLRGTIKAPLSSQIDAPGHASLSWAYDVSAYERTCRSWTGGPMAGTSDTSASDPRRGRGRGAGRAEPRGPAGNAPEPAPKRTRARRSGPREPTHVTIHAVAAAAGVSIGTVSRVLNHRSGVSPATREKVRAAVARLG